MQISKGSIYSLHKSSTRQHIQKTAMQQLKAKSAEVLAQLRYDLPPTFVFHKYALCFSQKCLAVACQDTGGV